MSTLIALPARSRARLEPLIERGEVVRWAGASDPDREAFGSGTNPVRDLIYVAFAATVMLGGFGVAAYLRDFEPLMAAVVGAFMLTGAGVTAIQHARERGRARRCVHAVTNRRIISVNDRDTRVVEAKHLASVSAFDSDDGWGDVFVDYRLPDAEPDDFEQELALRGVPASSAAVRAVERLAAEHGIDMSDKAPDESAVAAPAPQAA